MPASISSSDVPVFSSPGALQADDTRTRILKAALKLFRKHGYHGVGMTEILALAKAPKGSAYHHFPGGKQAIAVAVVQALGDSIVALMPAPGVMNAQRAVAQVGQALVQTIERTNHEICSMFSAFSAQRDAAPDLAQAVAASYLVICERLEQILQADGYESGLARDKARLVVMLFEGGGMLSAAHHDLAPFKLALTHAEAICAI